MSTISKAEANNLWNDLKNNLLLAQETLEKIVESRAWEPLGYETFVDAWADRLSGVPLAGVMEANVVYAMFDSGAEVDDAHKAVASVGPAKARAYKQAHDAKLAPKDAFLHAGSMSRVKRQTPPPGSIFVEAHYRKQGSRRNSVYLEGFTDEEIDTWKAVASKRKIDYREWLKSLLREAANEAVAEEREELGI